MPEFLRSVPRPGVPLIAHCVLAPGAMGAMDTTFMNAMAALLADRGIVVSRFEFAYMAERRTSDSRRPPPRAERLVADEFDVRPRLWDDTIESTKVPEFFGEGQHDVENLLPVGSGRGGQIVGHIVQRRSTVEAVPDDSGRRIQHQRGGPAI